jgi:hypothetical protein
MTAEGVLLPSPKPRSSSYAKQKGIAQTKKHKTALYNAEGMSPYDSTTRVLSQSNPFLILLIL